MGPPFMQFSPIASLEYPGHSEALAHLGWSNFTLDLITMDSLSEAFPGMCHVTRKGPERAGPGSRRTGSQFWLLKGAGAGYWGVLMRKKGKSEELDTVNGGGCQTRQVVPVHSRPARWCQSMLGGESVSPCQVAPSHDRQCQHVLLGLV